ncbi:MAG: hypothetical protein JWM96_1189 [Alphaproteobacteria bacterium]|nr:hypothetical protein [Alphaproteobacteria bacterium]
MKKLSLALSLLLLSGCSLLPKGAEAPRLFTLNPPQMAAQNASARLPVNLQILLPQVVPGLDGERIALRRSDNQIDYYADTKWAGNLNAVVQSVLVESFDASGALKSVGNDLITMNEDYALLVEIRDFQSEYIINTTTPRAHIRLAVKLIRKDTNEILSTRVYDQKENSEGDGMQQIITAFDIAFQRAAKNITADTVQLLGRLNR